MSDRTSAYEAKSDADGIESLSKRLTADVRESVRSLVRVASESSRLEAAV